MRHHRASLELSSTCLRILNGVEEEMDRCACCSRTIFHLDGRIRRTILRVVTAPRTSRALSRIDVSPHMDTLHQSSSHTRTALIGYKL